MPMVKGMPDWAVIGLATAAVIGVLTMLYTDRSKKPTDEELREKAAKEAKSDYNSLDF